MESGQQIVIEVDLTHDVVAEADGMICGGIMDIFIEHLSLKRSISVTDTNF